MGGDVTSVTGVTDVTGVTSVMDVTDVTGRDRRLLTFVRRSLHSSRSTAFRLCKWLDLIEVSKKYALNANLARKVSPCVD